MFRTSWTGAVIVVAVEILWFVLERMHIISPYIALALILITCGLAIWLLPYFTPTRLKRQMETPKP